MVRLNKKRRMQKIGIIIGLSTIILLFLLLLLNHLNTIRNKYIFTNLKEENNFTLMVKEEKNCQNKKYTFWEEGNHHYYGYCISNVYISAKGSKITLKEALKKKYLTLEDIMKKNSNIFKIMLIPTYQNNLEIIFSPIG